MARRERGRRDHEREQSTGETRAAERARRQSSGLVRAMITSRVHRPIFASSWRWPRASAGREESRHRQRDRCLREQGTNWMLVAATDPVPSIANQAQAKEIPDDAAGGQEHVPADRRRASSTCRT